MRKSLTLMLLVPLFAAAHGEDRPGPNGGYISMPGAFHVELVPETARRLKVYLLDIHWQNPTVQDSSVRVARGATEASCARQSDHYVCEFPPSVDLKKKGQLKVEATRQEQKGSTVQYALPLKFEMKH